MTTSHNPYTQMLVTFHPDRFYGRSIQVTTILNVITASEPTGHAIYGLRTMGKTTLLRFIKDPNGAMHHYGDYVGAAYSPGGGRYMVFAYVNFHNFSESDGSLFHLMLTELLDELHEDDRFDFSHDLPYADPQADRGSTVRSLKTLLSDLHHDYNIRVAFLMDDFDVPLHKQLVDAEDDHLLRELTEHAALIIATEDPIPRIRPDFGKSSPLLGILKPEAIDLLKYNEARELVIGTAEKVNLIYTEAEINFLLSVGGKQPFTLITACELYYNMRLDFPDIHDMLENKADSNRLRAQFLPRLASLPHVEEILGMLWLKIDEEERKTLHQTATSSKTATAIGQNSDIASQLANKGLMFQDIRQGVYRIFSEVFAYYISQRQTEPKVTRTLEPKIHEIKLPPRQTLDKLSPIDRRLLDYLIDNANRICTFDELLTAVWDDEMTNGADLSNKRPLEASVYRLRRDLDGYGQIRNVRGKGYIFVSGDKTRVHS